MLQTHGGEIRWRNIFVRDIGADEAKQILDAAEADTESSTIAGSDAACVVRQGARRRFRSRRQNVLRPAGQGLVKAAPTDEVRLVRTPAVSAALCISPRRATTRPAFKDAGVLGYNDRNWSTTVSVWLRLDPDKDLEPGYCDPVQIIGDDSKKGFIFLEWSKDETPRFFRYAIRPLFHIWNPTTCSGATSLSTKGPWCRSSVLPFPARQWTHAVFTLENVNDKSKPQAGRLYLNGRLQGAIENWDLTFGWDPARVLLVLGAAYVGRLDDLAAFDRHSLRMKCAVCMS